MLFKSLLALGAIQATAAHTIFTNFYVNGVDQGDNGQAKCVRMNMTPDNASSPVEDLSSNNMACGFDGTVGVARVCGINQSDTITFQFRKWADGSQPGVIAKQHYGPGAVYMKKVDSAIQDPGYGDGWFKIWDDGYNNDTGLWFTDKLIDANGLWSVELPSDLAGGYYLIRPEVLALHQANTGDPQFYMGCAQVFLNSPATATPTNTVSIPGYVQAGDPSVDFDIYVTPMPAYPLPGPEPYESQANINSNIVQKRDQQVQTEGLLPEGCILENGNWCGIELDSYSTMDGCWNASNACWDQDTTCWDGAPTGGKNCKIWEQRCHDIQNACNSSDYNGPPNKGTWLTPPSATISVPLAANTGSSDEVSSASSEAASSTVMSSAEAEVSSTEEASPTYAPSSYEATSIEASSTESPMTSAYIAPSAETSAVTSVTSEGSGAVEVTVTDYVVVTTDVTVTVTIGADSTAAAKAKRHAQHFGKHFRANL